MPRIFSTLFDQQQKSTSMNFQGIEKRTKKTYAYISVYLNSIIKTQLREINI